MYATNYFETIILNALRNVSTAAPSTVYAALYLSNPTETGMAGTEVTYSGYQRQPITFSAPALISGNIGVQNVAEITFPTTPIALQPLTHMGICDSVSGGNMLLYGTYDETLIIPAQGSPVIRAGDAQWWCVGSFSTAYKTSIFNFLRGQALTGFNSYLALFNGVPGSGGVELAGTGYARPAATFAAPVEQVSGQMQISNSALISFPEALSSWGSFTHVAVMNTASNGQVIASADNQIGAYSVSRGVAIMYPSGAFNVNVH